LLTKARGGKVDDKRQLNEAEVLENILDEVSIEDDRLMLTVAELWNFYLKAA
jgi:hypothetical protein